MTTPLHIIVRLWVVPGEEDGFRQFEDRAMAIMREHGVSEITVHPGGPDPEAPYEIHHLTFPSQAAFDGYRADARLAALAPLRDRVIARTEIEPSASAPE